MVVNNSNNAELQLPTAPIKLCERTLPEIAATGAVSVPSYNRDQLRAGWLHFGVGNFFRAHQAVYLDDLLALDRDQDWAILGANVVQFAEPHRRALETQDWLSTVVEQGGDGSTHARVLGSLIGCLGADDPQAIIDRMAQPEIRIVSMTITEGGYFMDPATGRFDPNHPAVRADVEQTLAGGVPRTVFGLILAALRRRREAGLIPFTVVSCDNILHNGTVTRNAVMGLAQLLDAELAQWISQDVAFPNGMVDRITPATGDHERRRCTEECGIEDASPVFCEPFRQWVLEDRFPAGRPALELVGVRFVPDVTPYENMKLRILNGGHVVLAHLGALLGIQHVHEFMENPLCRAFWRRVVGEEIVPSVPPVPDTDLEAYLNTIEQRFSNPRVADTIDRMCFNTSNRITKFIHPSIEDRLERLENVSGLALVSALWCMWSYQSITPENGPRTEPATWEAISKYARMAVETSPGLWLAMNEVYGTLAQSEDFIAAFTEALSDLQQADSIEEVIESYVYSYRSHNISNSRRTSLASISMAPMPSATATRRCSLSVAELASELSAVAADVAAAGAFDEETLFEVAEQQPTLAN